MSGASPPGPSHFLLPIFPHVMLWLHRTTALQIPYSSDPSTLGLWLQRWACLQSSHVQILASHGANSFSCLWQSSRLALLWTPRVPVLPISLTQIPAREEHIHLSCRARASSREGFLSRWSVHSLQHWAYCCVFHENRKGMSLHSACLLDQSRLEVRNQRRNEALRGLLVQKVTW